MKYAAISESRLVNCRNDLPIATGAFTVGAISRSRPTGAT